MAISNSLGTIEVIYRDMMDKSTLFALCQRAVYRITTVDCIVMPTS